MKTALFKDLPINTKFLFNSLYCVKKSTKTADIIINEKQNASKRFYFGKNDSVSIIN